MCCIKLLCTKIFLYFRCNIRRLSSRSVNLMCNVYKLYSANTGKRKVANKEPTRANNYIVVITAIESIKHAYVIELRVNGPLFLKSRSALRPMRNSACSFKKWTITVCEKQKIRNFH